jgi:hypothetical protein
MKPLSWDKQQTTQSPTQVILKILQMNAPVTIDKTQTKTDCEARRFIAAYGSSPTDSHVHLPLVLTRNA